MSDTNQHSVLAGSIRRVLEIADESAPLPTTRYAEARRDLDSLEEQLEAAQKALDEWEQDCDATARQRDDLRARLDRIRAAVESDPYLQNAAESVCDFLMRETEPGVLHVPGVSGQARTALLRASNPASEPKAS